MICGGVIPNNPQSLNKHIADTEMCVSVTS